MTTITFWFVCVFIILAYLIVSVAQFLWNLSIARWTGLPYVCVPVSEMNPVWQLTKPLHYALITALPSTTVLRLKLLQFSSREWRFIAKHTIHAATGNVFLIVSPGNLMVEIADAGVAAEVLRRGRDDFIKPRLMYAPLRLFGDNVVAAEGPTWKRHRKAVGPLFNDAMHFRVWNEAVTLANRLVPSRTTAPDTPTPSQHESCSENYEMQSIKPHLSCLALRVVAAAVFELNIPFQVGQGIESDVRELNNAPAGLDTHQIAEFSKSFEYMVSNVIKLLLVPRSILRLGPSAWRAADASYACVEDVVRGLMNLQSGKQTSSSALPGIAILKRSLQGEPENFDGMVLGEGKRATSKERRRSSATIMSEQEVLSNIFTLQLAGSLNTAYALEYSFVLLAMHPEIQHWVTKDVDKALTNEDQDPLKWQYQTVFPKLVAPLCVMLETLRIYPSVVALPRSTGDSPQMLRVRDQEILFPAKTLVNINVMGLHFDPKHWGPNPLEYRPQNWDVRCETHWAATSSGPGESHTQDQGRKSEAAPFSSIRTPVEGAYLPFSDGPRGCIGKRFAQIEFTAVLATVLRSWRVELAVGEGQTWADVRARTATILENSFSQLTLSIHEPVPLRFVKRA